MAVFMVTYTVVGEKAYAKLESFVNDKKTLTEIAQKLSEHTGAERIKFTKVLPTGYPVSAVLVELPESEA